MAGPRFCTLAAVVAAVSVHGIQQASAHLSSLPGRFENPVRTLWSLADAAKNCRSERPRIA